MKTEFKFEIKGIKVVNPRTHLEATMEGMNVEFNNERSAEDMEVQNKGVTDIFRSLADLIVEVDTRLVNSDPKVVKVKKAGETTEKG